MKFKKVLISALALGLLTSCGGEGDQKKEETQTPTSVEEMETSESEETQRSESEEKEEVKDDMKEDNQELTMDDEWIVDGMVKLKVNSVKQFEESNEFADEEPAQKILIDYSYENIGYNVNDMGLFIEPNSVIDQEGTMGDGYPAPFDLTYAKEAPEGAKVENAQATFGLKNPSDEVKIIFNIYDEDGNEYKGTFKAPIEK